MARKRFQPVDEGHDATLLSVQITFRDGVVEKLAVDMEIRRLKELFLVNVINCYYVRGHELQLFLYAPNRVCTEEEARERNETFDRLVESGFPAGDGLPAVPPQKLWRKHDLAPEKLTRVSDFMHFFSQAVCSRSRQLQGKPRGVPSGPHVAGRYKLVALDPEHIPAWAMVPGLKKAVNAWFGVTPVPIRTNETCHGCACAVGRRDFVARLAAEMPYGYRPSKNIRRITTFDLDLAWHYAKETDAEMNRQIDAEIGVTWAKELVDDIHDFCDNNGYPRIGGPEAVFLATLPFVMLLHVIDGTMRWRKLKRMKEDGTLDIIRAKAKANARAMLGLN